MTDYTKLTPKRNLYLCRRYGHKKVTKQDMNVCARCGHTWPHSMDDILCLYLQRQQTKDIINKSGFYSVVLPKLPTHRGQKITFKAWTPKN